MVQLVARDLPRDPGCGRHAYKGTSSFCDEDFSSVVPPSVAARITNQLPNRVLKGFCSIELTALNAVQLENLSRPFPKFDCVSDLKRHFADRFPFVLPPSARPELFTFEKIDATRKLVKELCREAKIPDCNYKLHLCFVDVVQPDGGSVRIPSHILSTFEYKGKSYGGPFLGSVLGNTLQVRGEHLDLRYRTKIVKESLGLTIESFGLQMLTIAVPQPAQLAKDNDPKFDRRAEWFLGSRSTAILAQACGGKAYQFLLDLHGLPFARERLESPSHQIYFTMGADLRPIEVDRKELCDRDFLRAMLVIDTARSSRGGKLSLAANRAADEKDSVVFQDLFIKSYFNGAFMR